MHKHQPFDLHSDGAIDALLAFHRAHFGDARMEADDDSDSDGGDDATGSDDDRDTSSRDSDDDRGDRDGLNEGGKRALDAERKAARDAARAARDEKKARETAEARVAELEREKMTAQERAEAERDEWRKKYEEQAAQLAARDLDILRRDVAAEKGLTHRQAARLRGDTREELEADADDLIREFGVDKAREQERSEEKPRTPRPDRSAGATTTGAAKSVSQTQAAYLAKRSGGGSAGGDNT